MISRESQSNLEGLVESSQVADERDVQAHQSDISTKCEEISNFGNNIRDELRQVKIYLIDWDVSLISRHDPGLKFVSISGSTITKSIR